MPSFWSRVSNRRPKACCSEVSAAASGSDWPSWMSRLQAATASGPLAAMRAASALTLAISSSAGNTASTRPMARASAAEIMSPVKHSSRAFATPTRRARRWVPPKPGMTPSLTSGWPKRALSAA